VSMTSAQDIPAVAPNPQYCDLKGSVRTSGEGAGPGSANFEVMLPSNWNGKFVFRGVGGLAGTLRSSANPVDEALFLGRGYATAITDTGHASADPTWEFVSPGQPNTAKIIDYFYRAVHQVTVAAKQIVKDYYSSTTISHSYFDGCSNGGKMGLIEATRYPNDYDGVISGSPWLDPLGTSLWGLKNTQALLHGYIPPSLFLAVDAAIKKQCDGRDGLADGLIQNPSKCAFDPDVLVPSVLTQRQADALKATIEPVRDEKGKFIYPGSSVSNFAQTGLPAKATPVNELDTPPVDPTGSQPWGSADAPPNWHLAVGIILHLGFHDPAIDLNNAVETDGVVKSAMRKLLYSRLGPDISGDPSKLALFLAKGGKLLIYHGYDDFIISPYRTIWFYEDLAKETGGFDKLQSQARLFMVPGMLHCHDGPGPNTFDTLSALENWVEKGVAPDSIVASHTTGNVVDRTMPLCEFPEQARYRGAGEVNDSANWSCPQNDRSLLDVGPNGVQAGLSASVRGSIRGPLP
jgi:tannase/feruloyl esterase